MISPPGDNRPTPGPGQRGLGLPKNVLTDPASQDPWEASVLGIDAAWTTTQPSGVALVSVATTCRPRLVKIARSYSEFIAGPTPEIQWLEPPDATAAGIESVISKAAHRAVALPRIVALDIPLAARRITARLACDGAISREYGGRWASTHSPSASRPGRVADTLFAGLSNLGYAFATIGADASDEADRRWFLETYPHPAIIEMLGLEKRLPYKVSRMRRYWPEMTAEDRWHKVAIEQSKLRDWLAQAIDGVSTAIPEPACVLEQGWRRRGKLLKGVEDALDALVCAYAAVDFLKGQAMPFGDEEATIWIPSAGSRLNVDL